MKAHLRRRYYTGPTIRIEDTKQILLLTTREKQALDLLSRGYSNAGIARELTITRKSVENLIMTLYQHMDMTPCPKHLHIRVRLALIAQGIDPDAT
jgi:DNA-binding NarL/FixJ family response regulator